MSFPTLTRLLNGRPISGCTQEQLLTLLTEAWKHDCARAFRHLKGRYKVFTSNGVVKVRSYNMKRYPELHMEMLRTFASSAIREVVLPNVFPNVKFDFVNCCADITSNPSQPIAVEQLVALQIQFQNGEKAYADC